MRSLILFISLVLVGLVLIAGCTETTPEVQVTPAVTAAPTPAATPMATVVSSQTVSPTAVQTPERAMNYIDSTFTLGRMHGVMLEAIEEALAYPVLKDPVEKADFESKIKDFDLLAIMFEKQAGLDRPENADLKASYESIISKKNDLVADAMNFFAVYEKNGTVIYEDVIVFEDSIDGFTSEFGPFTKNYFAMVSKEDLDNNRHAAAAFDLLSMHHYMIESVEEAFGYVLLNESIEKEEFAANIEKFDDAANAFVIDDYLGEYENKAKLAAYTSVMSAKGRMENAAYVMFAEFEIDGMVSENALDAFEKEVDSLTMAYDKLLEEVLKDL
ncbi:hypothetical protein [Methanoplanus endosymbiosus]|uniref:Uncharacterized protein n=1 Tax=Methanoplanus endosymbiosus TaxID=33865 RepID=A0A9E7PJR3_9EURY|nr:hypothetical protein [Methanoplanus endosymbiosus]UUX91220.1 hypothetical protein L6E24_07455 [Methanoplanus endosymbiosus]